MARIKLRAPTMNTRPRPMIVEAERQNSAIGTHANLRERERGVGE